MTPRRVVAVRREQERCSGPEEDYCSICSNFNVYATKKSVAQGLVDVALFSANGSKLRTILILRSRHDSFQQFYEVLFALLITSLCLQILQALLILYLSFHCNLNHIKYHKKANYINNIITALTTLTMIINAVIPIFDTPESLIAGLTSTIGANNNVRGAYVDDNDDQ